MRLEILKSEIETEHELHEEAMTTLIETGLTEAGYEWQVRYPKRALRFMDAMGYAGWMVKIKEEWKWVTELIDTYHPHADVYEQIFADLMDSYEWYADVSDLTQICIGEVELWPLQDSIDLAAEYKGW